MNLSIETNSEKSTESQAYKRQTRIIPPVEFNKIQASELLQNELGVSRLVAELLICRGYETPQAAKHYLAPSLKELLPDPSNLKNSTKAAELILQHIKAGSQITVYTDFDVDGITAGAQLAPTLNALARSFETNTVITFYTPNRFSEGYGLSLDAVERIAKSGTNLLITLDCGISSHAELARAKTLGLASIVVDHHQFSTPPPADVIINPLQTGCAFGDYGLCASALTWFLILELKRQASESQKNLPDPKELLDLAALGTICDMVPLTNVNRLLAQRGLEALTSTKRTGLIALKKVSGFAEKSLRSSHVLFGLGPRINASGRVDDARLMFELLTTVSERKALELSEYADRCNRERKQLEDSVKELCFEEISKHPELCENRGFALYNENFHQGVSGIVAQRIVEQFGMPAAVMAPSEELDREGNKIIKGSVRGIPGFHVAEALSSLKTVLDKHGGHTQAGGFSLTQKMLPDFQAQFKLLCRNAVTDEMLIRKKHADVVAVFKDITFDLIKELSQLEPFGIGNPEPLFMTTDVEVVMVQTIGKGHLKLQLRQQGVTIPAVAWKMHGHSELFKGNFISIAYNPEIEDYKGFSSVRLNIREIWK